MGVKLKALGEPGSQRLLLFFCPGCKCAHPYRVESAPHRVAAGEPVWQFNGNMERPSFTPSLLCSASTPEHRCHLYLTDGKIAYQGDCHHQLAGQTVDCPDWDDETSW